MEHVDGLDWKGLLAGGCGSLRARKGQSCGEASMAMGVFMEAMTAREDETKCEIKRG